MIDEQRHQPSLCPPDIVLSSAIQDPHMPNITINGKVCEFEPGAVILQVALDNGIEIPHYCYHPGLSIVANCRICLAEVWAPNPRAEGRLEPIPKLLPTCQTTAGEGQVVYTDSPKAIANQRAVMEYLLINHPVDCPVCDQAGECYLQDYSYQYGRGTARYRESKLKQPKKDLGPHVLLYMDRCIMCTRCVRFCREVTGSAEITVDGRGANEQIDVFPGLALDNELSANVIDLCPVGALLDKDFLFQQRVWFLKRAPSIDGLTASGDNIWVDHNKDRVWRIKPRTNIKVNKWWITDELRYGWKFVHDGPR
jgi:NADH-quinone oxidoreductase subunit G